MILEQWEVFNLVGRGRWVFVITIIILQLTYSVFVSVRMFVASEHNSICYLINKLQSL
jgi:hypothetical protein